MKKKLIATIIATFALVFGSLALAPATSASAEPCTDPNASCVVPDPNAPACQTDPNAPCPTPADPNAPTDPNEPSPADPNAPTTAAHDDYRAQVAALVRKVDRLQRIADKRAAKIKKLRAKIRALR